MSTWRPGPLVQERKRNKVVIPDELEGAISNHLYDVTVDPATGHRIGYRAVEYDRAANEYPKVLYHPEFGAKPKPEPADFARFARTGAELEAANASYTKALDEWNRHNRIKTVSTEQEEKKLLKIGWLPKPPVRVTQSEFDQKSDEL